MGNLESGEVIKRKRVPNPNRELLIPHPSANIIICNSPVCGYHASPANAPARFACAFQ